jgi:UDP-N-acetylglucosamine 1-carboxyvinyltransferase
MTRGDVILEGAYGQHLASVIDKLREAGVEVTELIQGLRVQVKAALRAVDITTQAYPGFPTDLQAPMMALMAICRGTSVITEKIYPDRFMHVSELARMGADVTREGASAIIKGVERLSGAPVHGSDLRATAALVLAGLAADNQTQVTGLEHLDRGYQALEHQLSKLGAVIRRTPYERRESPGKRKREFAPVES